MGAYREGGDAVRRFAAAAVLAVAVVGGGAGVAVAAPAPLPSPTDQSLLERAGNAIGGAASSAVDAVRGAPSAAVDAVIGDRCRIVPTPGRPTDGLAGWIDPGPSTPGAGLYSTFGWGGWAPVVHDPGCPIDMDLSVDGAVKRTFDLGNGAAKGFTNASLVEAAAAVQASQIVLEPSGGWAILTPFTQFVRYTMGYRAWFLFGGFALAVTGIYFLARARHGEVAEDGKASFIAGLILAAGAACLVLPVTVGPAMSQGLSAFYGAMSSQTAATAGQAGGSADAAIGDMYAEQILYPAWVQIHFGNNKAAADEFGMRLFYAGAMTRAEAERASTDPGYEATLTAAKRADYLAVAKAYQAKYPATYDRHLAGSDTSGRWETAAVGTTAMTPTAALLAWTLFWMGVARLAVELVMAVAPMGSLVAQFPRAQWVAKDAASWLLEFVVTALVATVVYVAVVVGLVGGVLAGSAPMPAKVLVMVVVAVLGREAWRRREKWLYRGKSVQAEAKSIRKVLVQILDALWQLQGKGTAAVVAAASTSTQSSNDTTEPVHDPISDPVHVPEPAPVEVDTDPRALDPDDEAVAEPAPERETPVVVSYDARRLPDPIDVSSPVHVPETNPAPPSAAELRFRVMEEEELERRRVLLTDAPARKEVSNVYVSAS